MTSFKFESNASIKLGIMGAIESGPMACIKLVHVAQVKVENFQNGLQFYALSAELQPLTVDIDLSSDNEGLTNGS